MNIADRVNSLILGEFGCHHLGSNTICRPSGGEQPDANPNDNERCAVKAFMIFRHSVAFIATHRVPLGKQIQVVAE